MTFEDLEQIISKVEVPTVEQMKFLPFTAMSSETDLDTFIRFGENFVWGKRVDPMPYEDNYYYA